MEIAAAIGTMPNSPAPDEGVVLLSKISTCISGILLIFGTLYLVKPGLIIVPFSNSIASYNVPPNPWIIPPSTWFTIPSWSMASPQSIAAATLLILISVPMISIWTAKAT